MYGVCIYTSLSNSVNGIPEPGNVITAVWVGGGEVSSDRDVGTLLGNI